MASTFEDYFKIILFFPIITFMILFTYNVLQDSGDDYIINETYNITLGLMKSGELNVSSATIAFLEDTRDKYYETNLPIDLIFLSVIIEIFLITCFVSLKSRKKTIFSFYGMVTFGAMLFLFIGTFIDQIVVWLFQNFYYSFFNLTRSATPIANWYIANSLFVNFIWFVVVVIINQLRFEWFVNKFDGGSQT